MTKTNRLIIPTLMLIICAACNKGETYADMKDKERNAIDNFMATNHFVGTIHQIDEATFNAQGQTTDVSQNQFVLFEDDGIYMQIVRKGEGQSMIDMAREQPDSTISKLILCRFLEYDIENADTTCTNLTNSGVVDKMLCKYTRRGRSYTASFTEGIMRSTYSSSGAVVPKGWLKPLDYIRLAKSSGSGEVAKVRLIVPHSSGTANAGTYVLPFYYEITYQLGK